LRIRDGVAVTKIVRKRVELTADWIRLHNEELDTLYSFTGMIRCGGACRMHGRGEKRIHSYIRIEKKILKAKDTCEDNIKMCVNFGVRL